MISMTRQQQGDFNRCCDFLARMIEKYGLALVYFLDEDMKQMPNETSERIYVIVQA